MAKVTSEGWCVGWLVYMYSEANHGGREGNVIRFSHTVDLSVYDQNQHQDAVVDVMSVPFHGDSKRVNGSSSS